MSKFKQVLPTEDAENHQVEMMSTHKTEIAQPIEQDVIKVRSYWRLSLIMVTIMSGGLNFGYSVSYLTMAYNTLFSIIELKGTFTEELGLFGSLLTFGCFTGSIISHYLMKHTTRMQSLLIADLFAMSSILMLIANREVILTFRFMYGVSCGISMNIQPLLVKEYCPERYFKQYSVLAGYFIGTGLLIGNLFSLGFLPESQRQTDSFWWRILFAMPCLMALFRQIVLKCLFKIDSPVQMVKRKNVDEAKRIIGIIYLPQFVETAIESITEQIAKSDRHKEGFMSIFTKRHRKTVFIGVMLMLYSNWCGIAAVFAYSGQLFEDMADKDLTQITIYTIILGFVQQSTLFISGWVFNKFGKRNLLLVGLTLMSLILIGITVLSFVDDPKYNILLFILICALAFVFTTAPAPIAWQMIPEINNDEGTYIGIMSYWVWQISLLYIFPFMKEGLGLGGSFVIFTIITVLCAIYFYFNVKETKGYTFAQIEQMYDKIDEDQQQQQ